MDEPATFALEIDGEMQYVKDCPHCNRQYIGGTKDVCPREDCVSHSARASE